MKRIIRKAYINYEKEEQWLNKMCSEGFALIDYSWCKYTFEECKPNRYIYRLEMLKNHSNNIESQNYIKFLEETGIEHVASYIKWVFLRKKTELGPFDLFSDLQSKLDHHKRIAMFLTPITLLNLMIGVINLVNWRSMDSKYSLILPFVNLILGGIIGTHVIRHFKKVITLKKEKEIYES